MNNNNLSNSIKLNSGIKDEKITRINLIKKSILSKEKLKLQEKLDEYRKFIDKKMKDITRNKNLCRTNRNKSFSKSKDNYSIEKNNKNNMSALINNNYELNNKINVLISNKVNKEEKKIKAPFKKIFICNRTQNLSEIFKKTQNKIIGSNKSKENSFINDKNNISALIYKNSDLNNKINVNVTNKINKEEKKIKTPIKKIFICNRTQNLSDIFKKTKNKIIRSNKSKENSFINDKSNISNPNKDYFGTQDSSKNDSNLKNNSFTQINFRQFIFSNKNNKKN